MVSVCVKFFFLGSTFDSVTPDSAALTTQNVLLHFFLNMASQVSSLMLCLAVGLSSARGLARSLPQDANTLKVFVLAGQR